EQIGGVAMILLQVAPLHQRGMAWDDGVDVLERGNGFRQRLRVGEAAAAVRAIDARRVVPREKVPRLQDAQCREVDHRVAVSVAGAKVEEVDALVAASN